MPELWNRILRALAPVAAPAPPASATLPVSPAVPARPVSAIAAAVAPRPKGTWPLISIVNRSTVVNDSQVRTAMAAAQIQIDRDFQPLWFVRADLVFVPHGATPVPSSWIVTVLDTSDQAGALGYHDMTSAGLPSGSVFAKDDQANGLSWTVTLTHELLEMLGDPYLDTTVFVQNSNTTGTLVACETCDAVESDKLAYLINGVLVSNFITPAFFQAARTPAAKFDFRGVLTAPLSIAAGGYLSVFEVSPTTTGWTQRFSETGPGDRFAAKGDASRPRRRMAWLKDGGP